MSQFPQAASCGCDTLAEIKKRISADTLRNLNRGDRQSVPRNHKALQGIAAFLTKLCIARVLGTTLIAKLHETEPILNSGLDTSNPDPAFEKVLGEGLQVDSSPGREDPDLVFSFDNFFSFDT